MDLETAIEAEKKARKALSAIRDEQDRRLHEARRAIHAEFGDAISAASKALNEASANVRKVKDTAPDHPWTGKRVRREKPVGYHWENRTETVSGIVETYRSTTHRPANRSEEHTSELQSLMRISYAVFCLNKKTHKHTKKNTQHTHIKQ